MRIRGKKNGIYRYVNSHGVIVKCDHKKPVGWKICLNCECKNKGVCGHCGLPLKEGITRCRHCYKREKNINIFNKRMAIKKGLCPYCRKRPLMLNYTKCEVCRNQSLGSHNKVKLLYHRSLRSLGDDDYV